MGQKTVRKASGQTPDSLLSLTGRGRLFLALGLVAVVLAGGVAWGVPLLLDRARLGRSVAGELANATGQRVRLEGAVQASFLPRPCLTLYGVKLLTLDGQGVALDLPRVDLDVSTGSLLGGRLSISRARFVNPHLYLARNREGMWSWTPSPAQARALSLWHATLEGGAITLTPGPGLPSEEILGIEGDIYFRPSVRIPTLSLQGVWRKAPVSLDLNVAAPTGAAPLPSLTVKGVADAVGASFLLSGTVDPTSGRLPLKAEVDATVERLKPLLDTATGWGVELSPLTSVLPSVPGSSVSLTATVEGEGGSYTLEGMKAQIGPQTWTGTARLQTSPRPGVSVAARTGSLIVPDGAGLAEGLRTGTWILPPSWLGAFDLAIARLTVTGVSGASRPPLPLEDVRLKGEVTGGLLRVSEAKATLPGETRVTASGTLKPKMNAPAEGEAVVALDTVRFQDLAAAVLPPSTQKMELQQVKLTTTLRGSWTDWGVPAFQATLDGMTLSGQISPPDQKDKDGLYSVRLSADVLDVARYAPFRPSGELVSAGLPAWIWTLPPARLNLSVQQLRLGDQTARNVALDATLRPTGLTLSTLDTDDFGGNRLRLAGTLTPPGTPGSDLTLQLTTSDLARFARTFPPAQDLLPSVLTPFLTGQVDASIRWKTTEEGSQFLQSATAGAAGAARMDRVTTFRPDSLAKDPRWKIRLRHPETAQVLQALAPSLLAKPDAVLGPLDLYAEGETQADGHWRIETVQGQAAGLSLRSGTLDLTPASSTSLLRVDGSAVVADGNADLWRSALSPLILPTLAEGALDLKVEKLVLAGGPLTAGQAKIVLGPGAALGLESFSGNWRGGSLTAKGRFAPSADPPLTGDLDAQNVSVTFPAGERFGLEGQLDLTLHAETRGTSGQDLVRNLEGDGSFSLDDGTISGLDVEELTRALKPRKVLANPDGLFARGGKARLTSLSGSFSLTEGVAKSSNLRLTSPGATTEGSGTLDLSAPRLDATLRTTLTDLPDSPSFGITLTGGTENLSASFETDTLTRWIGAGSPPPAASSPPEGKPEDKEGTVQKDPAKPGPTAPQEPSPPPPPDSVTPSPSDKTPRGTPINRPQTKRTAPPDAETPQPETLKIDTPQSDARPTPGGQPLSFDALVRRINPVGEQSVRAPNVTTTPSPPPAITPSPRAGSASPQVTFEPAGSAPAPPPASTPPRTMPPVAPPSPRDIVFPSIRTEDPNAPPAATPNALMKRVE